MEENEAGFKEVMWIAILYIRKSVDIMEQKNWKVIEYKIFSDSL